MIRLLESSNKSFSIQTGGYVIEYGVSEHSQQQVIIRPAAGGEFAIATRLADGFDLDPTDPKVLESLDVKESEGTITVTFRGRRGWAELEGILTVEESVPGLVHWRVDAAVCQDKAFYHLGWEQPDCEFIVSGKRHAHPVTRYFVPRGPAAGMIYFYDHALRSTCLYFEDYSSLNTLYETTGFANPFQVEADFFPNRGSVQMGEPPMEFQPAQKDGGPNPAVPWMEKVEDFEEFGHVRPAGVRLRAGQQLTLVDTYLYLSPEYHRRPEDFCRLFVEMLANVYARIDKPDLVKTEWGKTVTPTMLRQILDDPANWLTIDGQQFLRAYLRDPRPAGPEMITLVELLVPLVEYVKHYPQDEAAAKLKSILEAGLPRFYNAEWGGFSNSLHLRERESGWYLFWAALNVCDLALSGNADALRMVQASRDRLIDLGIKLDYTFAIINTKTYALDHFYNFEVTGVFVYVMMALYRLSGKQDVECLEQARLAAEKMRLRGFDLTYELNGVMAGAVGLQWLYEETGEVQYNDLAYIPLANVLRWAVLWECRYGTGKHSQSFWAFLPTPGNLNVSEHESHNARRFLRQFFGLAKEQLSAGVQRMIRDSWVYGPAQSRYCLPPFLVESGGAWTMVAEGGSETTCGVIDYTSYVPLEDVHVGWCTDGQWYQPNPKNGVVGQEIYGAGGVVAYANWEAEGDF
jgi:hypothetical protein